MNVADSNAQGNPSLIRLSPDQIGEQLNNLTQQLKATVVSAAKTGDSFDAVERTVYASVLELGRQAIELFLGLQGDGDRGPELETSQGQKIVRSPKTHSTKLRSIFGQHSFEEFTYSPGNKQAICLRTISARLSLPESRWSFLLQEFSQMLDVDQAYDQAMGNLGKLFGGKFSVDTAERINRQLGIAAGQFLADLPKPDAASEGKLLVASADCKGVPLVNEDSAKVAAFETAKKNPGNRRMATVTSVYSVDPYVRSAEEITAALFREDLPIDDPDKPRRPKPKNKNTTAHFPETADDGQGKEVAISGIHVGMAWTASQVALRRRPGQVLIALMDGQESLWETFQLHMTFSGRTIPILDILHALAYVWKAAGLFEDADSARKKFTRDRLLRILKGDVRGVIQGLRSLGTRRGLRGEQLKSLNQICGYLTKNADRMRYDEYLRRGYPIASGVIEGACRHLVKDRMERSGMRWTLEGARSMLNVRAAFQSDHWQSFLAWHKQKEVAAIHRHRDLIDGYIPNLLAV